MEIDVKQNSEKMTMKLEWNKMFQSNVYFTKQYEVNILKPVI